MNGGESGLAKNLDLWLSIVQRIAIIGGILAGVLFFFRDEAGEAHLKMDVSAVAGDCLVTSRVVVSNLKGRIIELEKIRMVIHRNGAKLGEAEQKTPYKLRIGEQALLTDTIAIKSPPEDGLAQVRTMLWIKGEQNGARISNDFVEGALKCES